MTIAADVANRSIRDAIQFLARELDKSVSSPALNLSNLQADVAELKADVGELKEEIFGAPEPEPTLDPAAPTRPVEPTPVIPGTPVL